MDYINLPTLAVAGAAVAAYVATRPSPQPIPCPCDLNKQSIELPGPERIHRSALSPGKLLTAYDFEAPTLYHAFQLGRKLSGNKNCMGTRVADGDFVWESYEKINTRFTNLGSYFVQNGQKPGAYIGIYSQNRAEWVIAEQACNAYSFVSVPLYDTLGAEVVEYISNQAEISVIVCDPPKIKSLGEFLGKIPSVKLVVKMGTVSSEEAKIFKAKGVELISIVEAERIGSEKPLPHQPPKPDDIATICYTSGTTGNPKGAILTHGNLISDVASAKLLVRVPFSNDDRYLSYLPLAHMFERIVQCMLWAVGAQVAFFRGDVKLLVEDIQLLKPTIFCSVPRLLNRVYDKVVGTVNQTGGIKKFLFDTALAAKEAEVKRGIIRRDSIWDKLVFKKVQASLGGHVRFILTGAAPISTTVLTFFRCALGCEVHEGYGQTESSAGATITLPGDQTPGHVGPPLPSNEIKLVDVPDMNYFAKDGKGEICFRGPNIFKGYLKDDAKTKEALDSDGWLHSGDIGEWTPSGCLKLIDRKKHIFKLAQGEYIAPEKIENIYARSNLIAQAFVYGNSLEPNLVAVVVPDPEFIPSWAKSQGIAGDYPALCVNPQVKKLIFEDMIKQGKEAKLAGFEQVKEIYVHNELFSVENNLLTPTFKSKRPELTKRFQSELDAMYKEIKKAGSN